MSDHPLKSYIKYFKDSNILSFKEFINGDTNNSLVAGTIMSIQEKKSSKGNPFAIIKFSDLKGEFELFLFSELLTKNRNILKAASSFILSLQKDNLYDNSNRQRINVKNILEIESYINKAHENVTIELNAKSNFDDLKTLLNEDGKTKVTIKIAETSKIYTFMLKKPRKFDFKTFNSIKDKEFVKKISF